jgi:phosphoenolpyruvate carboxykinase (ATP)
MDAAVGLVQAPDVPAELLDSRSTWSNGEEYDAKAQELARRFEENYRQYAEGH